jgi:predicted metal-binding membrane protein
MLWRYYEAVAGIVEARPGRLTALAGLGYFCVWTVLGMVTFPLGVALSALQMQSPALARAAPIGIGLVFLVVGALQFTAWKANHLARCRQSPHCGCALQAGGAAAWRHGLQMGLHCSTCCAGLTLILLVVGVMDLRAMAAVTAGITVERLAPGAQRVARIVGAVVVAGGLLLIARAARLG